MDLTHTHAAPAHEPVASGVHTAVLIIILLFMAAGGALTQYGPNAGSAAIPAHSNRMALYSSMIVSEWILFAIVWIGVRRRGVSLKELIGGRWKTPLEPLTDLAIGFVFWLVMSVILAYIHAALGPDKAKSIQGLHPLSIGQQAVWFALAVSAGICEETIFRGYFLRQFTAYTGSVTLGLVLQSILFGIGHGYQGWKLATTITVYGFFFGLLAVWRRSLRPGMIAHAWTDIYAGLIAHFLL